MTKDCSLHYSLCGPLQGSLVFLESLAALPVSFGNIFLGSFQGQSTSFPEPLDLLFKMCQTEFDRACYF